MSGSMGDMGNLLKQAQQMQQEIDRIRSELKEAAVEGRSPDGLVGVVLNGELHIQKVEVSPDLVTRGDAEQVNAAVLAALRDAATKVEALRQKSMASVTGGMNLPGLF